MYRNDETQRKYIDSAVSYILGPSCLTPAQIPAHHVTLQGGDTNQLVNTHDTHNGNPGKTTSTHDTINLFKAQDNPTLTNKVRDAAKFTGRISLAQKEGHRGDGKTTDRFPSFRIESIKFSGGEGQA